MNLIATIPADLTTLMTDATTAYGLVQDFVIAVAVFSVILGIILKVRSRTAK